MKIGEFSRLAQLSIRMLRHYDDIGLLSPQRVDPLTGYREYAAHQLRQLRRIQTLRDLGFSLDETRTFIQEQIPTEAFAARLRAKRDDLQRHHSEMEARLGRLDARLLALEQDHPMPDFDISRTSVPALLVVSVSNKALQVPWAEEVWISAPCTTACTRSHPWVTGRCRRSTCGRTQRTDQRTRK